MFESTEIWQLARLADQLMRFLDHAFDLRAADGWFVRAFVQMLPSGVNTMAQRRRKKEIKNKTLVERLKALYLSLRNYIASKVFDPSEIIPNLNLEAAKNLD